MIAARRWQRRDDGRHSLLGVNVLGELKPLGKGLDVVRHVKNGILVAREEEQLIVFVVADETDHKLHSRVLPTGIGLSSIVIVSLDQAPSEVALFAPRIANILLRALLIYHILTVVTQGLNVIVALGPAQLVIRESFLNSFTQIWLGTVARLRRLRSSCSSKKVEVTRKLVVVA